jgi:predicted Zn-dependent protease
MTGMMLAPGEHARLQIAHCDQRSISCRHGSVETCSHHQTSQGHVNVWADGRVGTASGPCDSGDALARLVRSARTLALVPAQTPPLASSDPVDTDRWIDDAMVTATTDELAVCAAEILRRVAERSSELVIETLTLTAETRDVASWHVRGAPRVERGARLSWAVSLMRRHARGATSLFELIGCDERWERGWLRLRTEVDELAARLVAMEPIGEVPAGRRVLLTPAAVADLVVPHLIMQLHAGRTSRCELSALLSLIEDPRAPGFMRTRLRERDGSPARRRMLVERGVVLESMTAGGPFGLTIYPGTLDDARLRSLGEVLCIGRFNGSIDPSSGRFSGVAKCSWLSAPGQPDAFVPELGIAGDLRALAATIADVTASRELVRGEVLCPGILVGEGLDYGVNTRQRSDSRVFDA